jgi:16S rRNA (uracil1498-N3)-methyltransferase
MSKFFVRDEQIENNIVKIRGADVDYIKKVLKQKVEDEIIVCNSNNEKNYLCDIKKIENEMIECKIVRELEDFKSNIKVTIMQGLPEKDKMDLVIQKSVELGAFNIQPVEMERCNVKYEEKDKYKKQEKWQKIAEVSAKQCDRNFIPKVAGIKSLKDICKMLFKYDVVILTYEKEKKIKLSEVLKVMKEKYGENEIKIAVIIGPEGGLSSREVEMIQENKNVVTVTLGKRILRTETVALNVLSVIMYELEG